MYMAIRFLGRLLPLLQIWQMQRKWTRKCYRNSITLRRLLDLRTEMERKEKPDVFIPNVEYQFIPIFDESMAGISHEKSLNEEQILAAIPKLGFLYRDKVTSDFCRENLGKRHVVSWSMTFQKAVFYGIVRKEKTDVGY